MKREARADSSATTLEPAYLSEDFYRCFGTPFALSRAMVNLELRKAFFFDLDGTLVDSNSAQTLSWQHAFKTVLGRHYSYARIRRLIGMPGNAIVPMLANTQENSPEGQRLSRAHSEIFLKKHLSKISAFPHARELIQALKSTGAKVAVTTTLKRGEMEKVLHHVGMLGSFDLDISIDDTEEAGPRRSPITVALEKLKLSSKDAYFVADTPYDIEAAASLGVPTIAFRSGGWDDEGLAHAVMILDDPASMLKLIHATAPVSRVA
jgi:pyrophosphatase PpaX